MTINTSQVAGRRQLKFSNAQDLIDEIDHILAAPSIQTLGNWSAAQVFEHLRLTASIGVGEFSVPTPLWMRLAGPLFKPFLLNRPMRSGVKLPKNIDTLICHPNNEDTQQAGRAFQQIVRRLAQGEGIATHPFLGKMTTEDWIKLQMRHAELHLSFLIPQPQEDGPQEDELQEDR